MAFFQMGIFMFFLHFGRSFRLSSIFLILTIFIFGAMGNWGGGGGGTFTHKFLALGNIFKKVVGDLIFYYDSTYKFRKKYFQRYLPTQAQLCDQLKELPNCVSCIKFIMVIILFSTGVYISLHFLLILLVKLGLCLSILVFPLLLWKQRIK